MPHTLAITDLHVEVAGREVLHGINLTIASGEVHVIMGPNGSGKSTLSHALMGRPGTIVTQGSITLDGEELLSLPTFERARRGLFLALQQPLEVPGVGLEAALGEVISESPTALRATLEAEADRVGMSGGEKKRNEMIQLAALRPLFAVVDEIDSGLDVDALAAVSQRLEAATTEWGLGILAVTHFQRLLHDLHADHIHVLSAGRIEASGGPELAEELERSGYAAYRSTR
jgi:Fe-S cluster assembly ATP-binding protein